MSARDDIHRLFESGRTSCRLDEYLDAHRAEVLAGNADAAAERDCLAMAVMFALQWKPDAPMGLREGIEEILTTMPAANAAPDFFRPGRTYTSGTWEFRCVAVSPSPTSGEPRALGWKFGPVYDVHGWHAVALDPDDWKHGDWTEAGEVSS